MCWQFVLRSTSIRRHFDYTVVDLWLLFGACCCRFRMAFVCTWLYHYEIISISLRCPSDYPRALFDVGSSSPRLPLCVTVLLLFWRQVHCDLIVVAHCTGCCSGVGVVMLSQWLQLYTSAAFDVTSALLRISCRLHLELALIVNWLCSSCVPLRSWLNSSWISLRDCPKFTLSYARSLWYDINWRGCYVVSISRDTCHCTSLRNVYFWHPEPCFSIHAPCICFFDTVHPHSPQHKLKSENSKHKATTSICFGDKTERNEKHAKWLC